MTPRAFQTLMRRRTFSILEASSSSLMFFTSCTCQLSLENSAFWRMLQALITSSRIVISFFKQRSISAAWPTATSTIVSYSDFQMKTSFLQKLTSAASIKISSSIWSKADLKLQGSLLFRDQLEEVIPKPAPLCQLEVTPPTIEAPARTITEGQGSERNQKRFFTCQLAVTCSKDFGIVFTHDIVGMLVETISARILAWFQAATRQ